MFCEILCGNKVKFLLYIVIKKNKFNIIKFSFVNVVNKFIKVLY